LVTIEDVAEYAGSSVADLESLADRLSAGADYTTHIYTTYNRGRREIVAPTTELDTITKNLHRNFVVELPYSPPPHVHGFVKGRSTLTNAAAHLNKPCVLRVDLREFFPSISAARVSAALGGQGFEPDAVNLCTRVLTIDGRLPIGLSTSPLISNMVFEETDGALVDYCKAEDLAFTRYVDDMIFSGEVVERNLRELRDLLLGRGWLTNDRKTVFMRRGGPQYVTGLFVGCADMPRIPRRIKRQMRRVCYLIEKFGYETYMDDFGGSDARMVPNRLYGWARYIASVEPSVGYPLLRLLSEHVPEEHPHSQTTTLPDYLERYRIHVVESLDEIL